MFRISQKTLEGRQWPRPEGRGSKEKPINKSTKTHEAEGRNGLRAVRVGWWIVYVFDQTPFTADGYDRRLANKIKPVAEISEIKNPIITDQGRYVKLT
jgi:hypothetical protein